MMWYADGMPDRRGSLRRMVLAAALGVATAISVAWGLGAIPTRLGLRRNELVGWTVPRELAWPDPAPAGWPTRLEWSSVGVTKETRGVHLAFPHLIAVWGRDLFLLDAWGTAVAKPEDDSLPDPQYYAERETFGWPWRAFQVVTMETSQDNARTDALKSVYQRGIELRARKDQHDRPPVLPPRPVWAGLAADAAVYGGAWWGLLTLPGARRRWRVKQGLCGSCGYPRGPAEVCSECGARPARRAPAGQ